MFEPPRLGFEAKIRKNIAVGFSGVHACVYISWACFPDDTRGCKHFGATMLLSTAAVYTCPILSCTTLNVVGSKGLESL